SRCNAVRVGTRRRGISRGRRDEGWATCRSSAEGTPRDPRQSEKSSLTLLRWSQHVAPMGMPLSACRATCPLQKIGHDRLAQIRRRLDLPEIHEELHLVLEARAEVVARHERFHRRKIVETRQLDDAA